MRKCRSLAAFPLLLVIVETLCQTCWLIGCIRNSKESIFNLLADFRDSRTFSLLCQAGQNDAQMQQKCKIRETL